MAHHVSCPSCGHPVRYASSDAGTERPCSACGSTFTLPLPDDVQEVMRASEQRASRAREELEREQARWANHDHIANPEPWGDFNGFFETVRTYARRRGLAMAETLRRAGLFTIPPTEDYGETLLALRRVREDELRRLPLRV
jgi:hypothetical protein